ncbi:MAG TPA: hypothetical protein VN224_09165, partial [Xanthomonadales bacterium]|nr:hypothetical protein [Xanthomonadales bacterium]
MGAVSNWSIGTFGGESVLDLTSTGSGNPVLTRDDVTDAPASFVADPFMIGVDGAWHMYFEVMRADRGERGRGAVGHATSADGRAWRYDRIVLDEPFHLSYPLVLRNGDALWMVPESHEAGAVRLYRAESPGGTWSHAATLLHGELADPTVFEHDGRWWMFAAAPARRAVHLHLFSARAIAGPWREHPHSPVVRDDAATARPAGRVVVHDGMLLRFAQDCSQRYGASVSAYEIVELSETRYRERALAPVPL